MSYLPSEYFNSNSNLTLGRKIHRNLSSQKANCLKNLLPKYIFTKNELDKRKYSKIWCEIGFGSGERILEDATRYPEIMHIGVDFFLNGIADLLLELEKSEKNNIMIWPGDGESFLNNLPLNCLDRTFILFPNPWPKRKHYKRRLINQQFLNLIAVKSSLEAELLVATDHIDYGNHILRELMLNDYYQWKNPFAKDYFDETEGWIRTKYQEKSLSGNKKHLFLNYRLNKLFK